MIRLFLPVRHCQLARHRLMRFLFVPVLLVIGNMPANAVAPQVGTHPAAPTIPGLQIIRLGRGHYNRLCLAATLEGNKGLMMLDTGASQTTLSETKYGSLRPGPNRKLPPGVPATVPVNGERSVVGITHDFHVGETDLGPAAVVLVPRRGLYDQTYDSDRQYDGLLGENFLRRYRAVVDCGRLALYLNTNPAHKLNLGPALVQAGWTRVPMSDLHNDFVVPCEINGHHFRMIVDTGSPFAVMDRSMLEGAQVSAVDIPMSGGVIGARSEKMGYVRLPTASFGDYHVASLQVVADPSSARFFQDVKNDQANGKVLGLLGGSFLAANNAIIDVGSSSLYLKRNSAANSNTSH